MILYGPWYNTMIFSQLHGSYFEDCVTTARKDRYNIFFQLSLIIECIQLEIMMQLVVLVEHYHPIQQNILSYHLSRHWTSFKFGYNHPRQVIFIKKQCIVRTWVSCSRRFMWIFQNAICKTTKRKYEYCWNIKGGNGTSTS